MYPVLSGAQDNADTPRPILPYKFRDKVHDRSLDSHRHRYKCRNMKRNMYRYRNRKLKDNFLLDDSHGLTDNSSAGGMLFSEGPSNGTRAAADADRILHVLQDHPVGTHVWQLETRLQGIRPLLVYLFRYFCRVCTCILQYTYFCF